MRILFFLLINCIAASAQVERYSVLIHEIMADPSPIVGLPNAEYVELRNTSSQPIELFRWKIDNGTTTATISSYYLLLPIVPSYCAPDPNFLFFQVFPIVLD